MRLGVKHQERSPSPLQQCLWEALHVFSWVAWKFQWKISILHPLLPLSGLVLDLCA